MSGGFLWSRFIGGVIRKVGTTRVTAIEGKRMFFTALPSSVLNATFNKIKGKRTKGVLKALFERPTTQDLVNLRCREDDDVREHFDKLANTREQLSTMDKSTPDAMYAKILMPSYQSLTY
jgi:hypothetical protein